MNRKAILVTAVVLVFASALAVRTWYFGMHRSIPSDLQLSNGSLANPPTPQQSATSSPSTSTQCSQSPLKQLITYEDRQMGITFCYSSDVTVTTGTLTWSGLYTPVVGPYKWPDAIHPTLNFKIIEETASSSVIGDIGTFDTSGATGDSYTRPPRQSQIVMDQSESGLPYKLFREDYVFNNALLMEKILPYGIPIQDLSPMSIYREESIWYLSLAPYPCPRTSIAICRTFLVRSSSSVYRPSKMIR